MNRIISILLILTLIFGGVNGITLDFESEDLEDNKYFSAKENLDMNFLIIGEINDLNYFWFKINDDLIEIVSISDWDTENDKNYLEKTLETTYFSIGKNTLTFDANYSNVEDGNVGKQTITFFVDSLTPDIIGFTATKGIGTGIFSNEKTPTFTFELNKEAHYFNGGKLWFSCTSENENDWNYYNINWTQNTKNIEFEEFNVTTGFGCNSDDETKKIYTKITDMFDRNSSVRNLEFNYDGTPPTPPKNFNVVAGDGEVIVSWSAPDADMGGSGNQGFELQWRTATDSDWKVHSSGISLGTTQRTITELTNGTEYSFRMLTIDGAGNKSNPTSVKTATPEKETYGASLSVRRDNQNVDFVKNNDNIEVRCSFEDSVSNARIRYRTYVGSSASNIQNLGIIRNNVTNITENFVINSNNYDRVNFWCDVDGDSVTTQKEIRVDNELPVITWPSDFNTIFVGQRNVSVTVTDNRGVSRVDFEINGVTYGTNRSGNNYSATINTNNIENGSKTLKVIAIDVAANRAESSKTIIISNALTPLQEAQKLIDETKTTRQIITDLINYLKSNGIVVNEEIENEKQRADALLLEAESETNAQTKKEKANQAKSIYEELIKNTEVEEINNGKQIISLSEEEIVQGLLEKNINHEMIETLKERVINSEAKRELNILKIGQEYIAQIIITLDFDTNDDEFKIIEIIPKEFVENANLIKSDFNFNIISENPIIEFIVPKGTTKISYNISDLNQSTAISLIENNVSEKFTVPPIILKENEQTKKVLTNQINLVIIGMGILFAIFILLAIIGGIIYLQKQKDGFSSNTNNKSFIEKIKEILPKNNKQKNGPGKWKHKE